MSNSQIVIRTEVAHETAVLDPAWGRILHSCGEAPARIWTVLERILMKNNFSHFIVAVVLISSLASAAAAQTYLGAGGTSCGEYIQFKQSSPENATAVDFWVLGYVSGLNMLGYSRYKTDLLINQSHKDVIGFVNGYCAANDKRTLNNAANEYWVQIVKRYGQ